MRGGPHRREDLVGSFLDGDEKLEAARRRLGGFIADRVFGLVLPAYRRTQADSVAADHLATGLGIDHLRVQLLPFVHLFQDQITPGDGPADDVFALTDAVDRLRSACVYFAAETMNRLVVGPADRTAWLLGRVTKYGADYGDLLPLGWLYRTEVERLAARLDLAAIAAADGPASAAFAGGDPPSPDWSGITRDTVLRRLVDEDAGIDRTAEELDLDPGAVRAVAIRCVRTRHKRRFPPTPATRTGGRDGRFHGLELAFG